MIVESKILLEIDTPTISGLIYPKEIVPGIMTKILHSNIGGVIQTSTNWVDPRIKEPVFKLVNPQCIVDETEEEPQLLLICDVDIDETKLSPKELNDINTKPWRLSIIGQGDVDFETKTIKDYEIKYTNIEIIDEKMYNEEK